ncbi:MAG: DNA-3-methyladenine glycosylase I [Acidobacteriota bacterium]|nr:DNA-3-methyladenine glycosylase I [Acidobacteriota bacterium]
MSERCPWAGTDPRMIAYHDHEWGVPTHEDRELFELLTLEGAQAGLSWSTILNKRDAYRRAFRGFEPETVARFNRRSIARLLGDAGIVRNRLKIESTVRNAKALIEIQNTHGSFDAYLWSFVDGAPIVGRWHTMRDVPVTTAISDTMSKDLKKRGFSFVGSTICYSLMQAVGLVDDHVANCFRAA